MNAYEKKLAKRRRRKKIAALVVLIGGTGTTTLGIIAFLGRNTGTFTVSLRNEEVKLSLSDAISYEKPTSYLRIASNREFEETTFRDVIGYSDALDDENVKFDDAPGAIIDDDGNVTGFKYFKYTFYVRNVGTVPANYVLEFKNLDNVSADDGSGRTLADNLRVLIYDNDAEDTTSHEYDVYAKAGTAANYLADGTPTYREFVGESPLHRQVYGGVESEQYPLAETFIDDTTVARKSHLLLKGETRRYTIVTWLEGWDPQSAEDYTLPEGSTIKLGIEVNAHKASKAK